MAQNILLTDVSATVEGEGVESQTKTIMNDCGALPEATVENGRAEHWKIMVTKYLERRAGKRLPFEQIVTDIGLNHSARRALVSKERVEYPVALDPIPTAELPLTGRTRVTPLARPCEHCKKPFFAKLEKRHCSAACIEVAPTNAPTSKEIDALGWRPMEVHPLAVRFPMRDHDELANLAEDIKQSGLQQKIILDFAGRLVDGRNRLAACDIAGVEPAYEQLNGGDDTEALIWSLNSKRWHMNKGQLAMVAALPLDFGAKSRMVGGIDRGLDEAAAHAGVSASP